jgi:general secretion pathway protein A
LYGYRHATKRQRLGWRLCAADRDIGTGKTTICRCFLEQIPAGCHVAYIFNPKLTVTELLQSICEEFHIPVASPSPQPPTVKAYIDALNAFLLESHAQGQSCVLIIDEAQNLQADVLEQLRLLTNLETSERKLLQIVLIGQPELRSMLERPELEQLAQRVIARFHLDALSEAETEHYIATAWRWPVPRVRCSSPPRRIHQLARGVLAHQPALGRALGPGPMVNARNRTVVDRGCRVLGRYPRNGPTCRSRPWPGHRLVLRPGGGPCSVASHPFNQRRTSLACR